PSACQPSKKFGSRSTQRWYFATALSSSPIARSPLASSKISSRVDSLFSQKTTNTHQETRMTKTKADQPFPIRVHSCQFVVKPESLCHPKYRSDASLWLVANRRRAGGHTTI